jgi:hypothetical protein
MLRRGSGVLTNRICGVLSQISFRVVVGGG